MDLGNYIHTNLSAIDLGIIAVYMTGMLSVGYIISRRVPNFEEYMVAGRTMTTPILICTLVSTYYGLDVLFGTSELAYRNGLVAFFGYSMLSLGFYFFAAIFLVKPLRNANFTSLPEVLERNYGPASGALGALASFAYSIPALSLFGVGRLCEVLLGVDAQVGALVVGAIALLYTLWGGLWAVAITDTVQFVLMCVTLAVAIPIVMHQVGGFDAVALSAPDGFFNMFGSIPIWLVIAYGSTGLAILVDPGFYQRVFAARNYRQARNALLVGIVVWGAYDWLVVAGGMLGVAAVSGGALSADIHPNDVLLTLVMLALPVGLTGLFMSGTLAAAMSTIDSYSLVAGGNLVYDLYRPLVKPHATDRELMRLTKLGIVFSWVVGYLLAFAFDRLLALWVFTASILMSTTMIPIMLALFTKRPKKPLAGLLSASFGLVGVVIFYPLLQVLGVYNAEFGTYIWTFEIAGKSVSLWQEYCLFFTMPLSLLGYVLGSVLGRKPPRIMETGARE